MALIFAFSAAMYAVSWMRASLLMVYPEPLGNTLRPAREVRLIIVAGCWVRSCRKYLATRNVPLTLTSWISISSVTMFSILCRLRRLPEPYEIFLPVRCIGFGYFMTRITRHYPRVVHQYIRVAEPLLHFLEEGFHCVLVQEVCRGREKLYL